MTFDDRTEDQDREKEDTFPADNEAPMPPAETEETGREEQSRDEPPVSRWTNEPRAEEGIKDTEAGIAADDADIADATVPADERPLWLRDFNGEPVADESPALATEYEPEVASVDESAEAPVEYAAPAAPRRKALPVVTTISVVLLCLGLVALTWWGLRQHNERRLMEETLETALLGLGAEVPEHMQADVEGIRARLRAGDFETAGSNLRMVMSRLQGRREGMAEATGGMPLPGQTDEGAGGEPIPESAYEDLPPDAATFFRQREPLFRRFLLMCAHARELKEQGVEVEPLRQVRDATIEAARLGQEQAVLQHMERFQQMLDSTDGGPQQGPTPQIQQKFAQFQELVAEAQRTNRDPRQAFNLMSQADEAARGGDMQAAERFIDQAIAAIRRAPAAQGGAQGQGQGRGMAAGRGTGAAGDMMARRGAAGGGREMMPQGAGGGREMMTGREAPMGDDGGMQTMLRNLLSLVSMEEGNLQRIWQNLQDAHEMLSPATVMETSAANLRPLVESALAQMQEVAQRRHEFSAMIEGTGPPIGQAPARPQTGRPPQDPTAGQAADQQQRQFQEMLQIVTAHVDEMLEHVREMSPEEFEEYRERLVQSLIGAVLDPQALVEAKKAEPTPEQLQRRREELIRTKLRAAAPEFYKQKNAGEDVEEVEELFASSRGALYTGMLDEADEYVNDALKMLGLLPDELITDTTRPPAARPQGFEAAPGLEAPPGGMQPFGAQTGRERFMRPETGVEGGDGPRLRYSRPGSEGQRPGGRGGQGTAR